jgi:hypothetical protein
LKTGRQLFAEYELRQKIRKLEEKLRSDAKERYWKSCSWNGNKESPRRDVTLDIPLGLYMEMFEGESPVPRLVSFDYESEKDNKKGKKQYFAYPSMFVGSVDANSHVWVEARTDSIWSDDTVPLETKPEREVVS